MNPPESAVHVAGNPRESGVQECVDCRYQLVEGKPYLTFEPNERVEVVILNPGRIMGILERNGQSVHPACTRLKNIKWR